MKCPGLQRLIREAPIPLPNYNYGSQWVQRPWTLAHWRNKELVWFVARVDVRTRRYVIMEPYKV